MSHGSDTLRAHDIKHTLTLTSRVSSRLYERGGALGNYV